MAGLFVLSTNTVSAKANAIVSNLSTTVATATIMLQDEAMDESTKGFTQVLKEQFIQGGAGFMGIVLLTLILGLAMAIERIIYLNLSTTNTQKLLNQKDG